MNPIFLKSIKSRSDIPQITEKFERISRNRNANEPRGTVFDLDDVIDELLPKGIITIYEAFQLYEITDRLGAGDDDTFGSIEVMTSVNLALMAKLFGEDAMYSAFCADAKRRSEILSADRKRVLKEHCGAALPENGPLHYILDDLDGVLSADRQHLELLSSVRPPKRHRKMRNLFEPYHWDFFPYDFAYEDKLLEAMESGVPYSADKNISPEVCDLMAAAEVRGSGFYRFHNPGRWKNVHFGTDIPIRKG